MPNSVAIKTKRHHLDRRADLASQQIIGGDDDQLLDTPQLCELLKCSHQWLEIGRHEGWGPPFVKLAPRMVRYRRGDVREWLHKRSAMFQQRKAVA